MSHLDIWWELQPENDYHNLAGPADKGEWQVGGSTQGKRYPPGQGHCTGFYPPRAPRASSISTTQEPDDMEHSWAPPETHCILICTLGSFCST